MKGRHTSFQRFGRVFGLSGSVLNKYPRTQEKAHADGYISSNWWEKTPVKGDCHDNYGCESIGISQWHNEKDRKTKEDDVRQFFYEASKPAPCDGAVWNKDGKWKDYTPIAQENVPLCSWGNHQERVIDPSERTKSIELKPSPGFHEGHNNRPAKASEYAVGAEISEDNANTGNNVVKFSMPAGIFHQIMSRTKEIQFDGSLSMSSAYKTIEAEGTASPNYGYFGEYTPTCPPGCPPSKTQTSKISCSVKSGVTVLTATLKGEFNTTLKRFLEYTDLSSEPTALHVSRNCFSKEKRYILTKGIACDYIGESPYGFFGELYSQAKLLKKAEPKTTLDSGCLTTPYMNSSHYNYKRAEGEIVDVNAGVSDCNEGGVISTSLDMPYNFSIYDNTPQGGGPSLEFSFSEDAGLGSGRERYRIAPKLGKWTPIYQESTDCYDNPIVILDPQGVAEIDPDSRNFTFEAKGTCVTEVYGKSFCVSQASDECNAWYDACTGKWSNDCPCSSETACDDQSKEDNIGSSLHAHKLSPATAKPACRGEKDCCDYKGSKDSAGSKFSHTLSISGSLGRYIINKGGSDANRPSLIPIEDVKKNSEDIEVAFYYYIQSSGFPFDRSFYLDKRTATYYLQWADTSNYDCSISTVGTFKLSYLSWSKEFSIYAIVCETKGTTQDFGVFGGVDYHGAYRYACQRKGTPIGKSCACSCFDGMCYSEDNGCDPCCGCTNTSYLAYATARGIPLLCAQSPRGGTPAPTPSNGCSGCRTYKSCQGDGCKGPPCCGVDLGCGRGCGPCSNCAPSPTCTKPENNPETLTCPVVSLYGCKSTTTINTQINAKFMPFTALEG
jgi:hypothetical protein